MIDDPSLQDRDLDSSRMLPIAFGLTVVLVNFVTNGVLAAASAYDTFGSGRGFHGVRAIFIAVLVSPTLNFILALIGLAFGSALQGSNRSKVHVTVPIVAPVVGVIANLAVSVVGYQLTPHAPFQLGDGTH